MAVRQRGSVPILEKENGGKRKTARGFQNTRGSGRQSVLPERDTEKEVGDFILIRPSPSLWRYESHSA